MEKSKNLANVLILQLCFLILLSLIYILNGVFPSIEFLFAICIMGLVWKRQYRNLLINLIPFFVLLLTYQSLRNFADNLTRSQIHIMDLIYLEKLIFHGIIPSWFLQTKILNSFIEKLVDPITNILYMSHFVIPVIIAIILWYREKRLYWQFIIGLLIVSYLGFITYVFFPAAPPWWATKYGYLLDQPVTLAPYFNPDLVESEGPNPVAAMPSLHMAYSSYIAIFIYYAFNKKWIFLLPIAVGFSTVYLGHHYVIDLIAGLAYALIVFYFLRYIHVKNKKII